MIDQNEFHEILESYGYKRINDKLWKNYDGIIVSESENEVEVELWVGTGRVSYGKANPGNYRKIVDLVNNLDR